MIKLRLTHGLSHDNGYVRATKAKPFVTVEDEAVARFCVDSGFFEIVEEKVQQKLANAAPAADVQEGGTKAPTSASEPEVSPRVAATRESEGAADDSEELEAMSVAELKAYAETTGINLGRATRKADIIAIIREEEAKA